MIILLIFYSLDAKPPPLSAKNIKTSHAPAQHTCTSILRVNGMGTPPYPFEFYNLWPVHQHVYMHQHVAHPPNSELSPSIIDNISDTLLNAFSRVKKPDERFLDMREGVSKFEDGLNHTERLYSRIRNRTSGKSIAIIIVFSSFRVWGWMRWKPWIWWRSHSRLSRLGCGCSGIRIFGIRYNGPFEPLLQHSSWILGSIASCCAFSYLSLYIDLKFPTDPYNYRSPAQPSPFVADLLSC